MNDRHERFSQGNLQFKFECDFFIAAFLTISYILFLLTRSDVIKSVLLGIVVTTKTGESRHNHYSKGIIMIKTCNRQSCNYS